MEAEQAPTPQASLAIAGLDPAKITDIPKPPGSRQAGFSGGPALRAEGGDGDAADATIVVPGLLAHGGAKDPQPVLMAAAAPTSRETLREAVRLRSPAVSPPPSPAPPARMATAPDPMLEGRIVYMLAIQMPNVTSYIGSWTVWFAEREHRPEAASPEMRAPTPLRKVDPKYVAAAIDERVEGRVRLSAVIRKTGRVDSILLLRHLDDRLDRSAQEALAKWEFAPALRDGVPVDVDAVFEIPFRLAPRPAR
jgi:TonB family protein